MQNVGLSRATPLNNIQENTSMGLEANQLDVWDTSINMLLNGEKSANPDMIFKRHTFTTHPRGTGSTSGNNVQVSWFSSRL
jgi:hypothetical protein